MNSKIWIFVSISTNKSSRKLRVILNDTVLRYFATVLIQHSFPVGHYFSCDSSGAGLGEGLWLGQRFLAYFSFLLVSLKWNFLQGYSKLSVFFLELKIAKKLSTDSWSSLGSCRGQIPAGEKSLELWILRLCSFLLLVDQIWLKMRRPYQTFKSLKSTKILPRLFKINWFFAITLLLAFQPLRPQALQEAVLLSQACSQNLINGSDRNAVKQIRFSKAFLII